MKPVQGYTTDDGTFFESKREAQLYEAEMALRDMIQAEFPRVQLELVMALLVKVMPQLRRYCDAYFYAPNSAESEIGEASPIAATTVDGRAGFFTGTEEDIKGVLQLPSRGHRHVPDLGSRPYAKEIPDGGEVDGA